MNNIPLKPEGARFTDSQWQSVYQGGSNLLVSASAGSGKTTVLVERILQNVLQGIRVDEMLVVTFTELAAKEMKERLEIKIQEEINRTTDAEKRSFLIQQIQLLPTANISTLHAFCKRVIEQFFYLVEIDPLFTLMTNEVEKSMLKEKAFHQMREEMYEIDGEINRDFYELTEIFSGDRNDEGLQTLVFSLVEYSLSHPHPEEYIHSLPSPYDIQGSLYDSEIYQQFFKAPLQERLRRLRAPLRRLNRLSERSGDVDFAAHILEIQTTVHTLGEKIYLDDIEEARESLSTFPRKSNKGVLNSRSKSHDVALKSAYVSDFETIKGVVGDLKKEMILNTPEEVIQKVLNESKRIVETLVVVIERYQELFQEEKRKRNALDFNDLERYCLAILRNKNKETGICEAQAYFKNKFKEVMIDEYQDTNEVQEAICQLVSSGENQFIVGDVKQSIYMFRQADPSLFSGKYNRYIEHDGGELIELAENFRSRSEVLDFTNYVFCQLMDQGFGEISYTGGAELIAGNKDFPKTDTMKVEVLLYQQGKKEESKQEEGEGIDEKIVGEIKIIASKISEMVKSEFEIYDKELEANRPITFSDIALLAPTRNNNIDIQEIFEDYRLPIIMNNVGNFFKTTEVKTLLSILTIIDNPYQDIPFVSVLRSPVVALTEEELGKVRQFNATSFYHAFLVAKEQEVDMVLRDKLQQFDAMLEDWREFSKTSSIYALIWKIFQETGIIDLYSAMKNGKQREANLYALAARAEMYESTSFKGIFQFLKFIEKMQEKDEDLGEVAMKEVENTIRMYTIHGSKGLEFPITIVMDLAHRFNLKDIQGTAIFDPTLGIGMQYLDVKQRVKYNTLIYEGIRREKRRKILAEEMRKLYVAMTRAEQKLILTGSVRDAAKTLTKWGNARDESTLVLSQTLRTDCSSLLDWIGLTLARSEIMDGVFEHPTEKRKEIFEGHHADFLIKTFDEEEVLKKEQVIQSTFVNQKVEKVKTVLKKKDVERMLTNIETPYRFEESTSTSTYHSVSEIKQFFNDPDDEEVQHSLVSLDGEIQNKTYYFSTLNAPSFIQQKKKEVSAAEIGTATHHLLKIVDFTKPQTIESLEALVREMVEKKLIEKKLGKHINLSNVLKFFHSPFGEEIQKHASTLRREAPFSLLLSPNRVYPTYKANEDSPLLIHGIIDGFYETKEGIVLFDYKTDAIEEENLEQEVERMKESYLGQQRLYKEAIEASFGKPVVSMKLVLLSINEVIELLEK